MTTTRNQARIEKPEVETLSHVLADPVRAYGFTGYVVSWAVVADAEGFLWVNGSAQVMSTHGGPVDTKVRLNMDLQLEVWQSRYAPILEPRGDINGATAGDVTWIPVVRYEKEPLDLASELDYD